MKTTRRLTAVASLVVAAAALSAGTASAAPAAPQSEGHDAAAVFAANNDLAGNTVVAFERSSDGTLRQTGAYPTGGLGGKLDGGGFVTLDPLDSQGALTLDEQHGLLYDVNPGSDTLTVFGADGDHLSRRQVLPTNGSFPVSVATNGNFVYVLNARDGGSIQGYLRVHGHLVLIPAWYRALGLDPTSPPEFIQKPGQVGFTPDGKKLVITTKASGESIDVYSLDRWGTPAAEGVATIDPLQVPFAFGFDHHDNLIVAEAFTDSVSTFRMNRDDTVTLIQRSATGQLGTCWVTVIGKTVYLANIDTSTLSIYRDSGNGQLSQRGVVATALGTIDNAASSDGRFLYVQTGGAGTVEEYRVHADGSLTLIGSVPVPHGVGQEGIAAS